MLLKVNTVTSSLFVNTSSDYLLRRIIVPRIVDLAVEHIVWSIGVKSVGPRLFVQSVSWDDANVDQASVIRTNHASSDLAALGG